MEVIQQVVVTVEDLTQPGEARRLATALATRAGLDVTTISNAAIVVTEAATNLVKHARGGEILVRAVRDHGGSAISILALDGGPGIGDLERALRDGHSTAGSQGTGLGAIRRLSASFDVYSSASGTALMSRVGSVAVADPVEVGVVSVARPGEEECGDACAVVHAGGRSAVLVVDGLGHGLGAAEAARAATRVFVENADRSPPDLLAQMHDALRATRGAAAAVAALDRDRRIVRFAGIGNIAGAVIDGASSRRMVSHHGTLGHQCRKIQEFTYPWPAGSLVVVHSDGVSSHWSLDAYPGLAARHPLLTAGVLYRDHRRRADDATIVVLREAA